MEDHSTKNRPKILFLTAWYPSRIGPSMDIFMVNQARAISKYCDVSVLFVTPDQKLKNKNYEINYEKENGIPTTRVYFKFQKMKTTSQIRRENAGGPITFVRNNLDAFFLGIKYLIGFYLGFNQIRKGSGKPDIIHLNVVSPRFWLVNLLLATRIIPYVVTEHFSTYIRKDENSYENYPLPLKLIFKITFRRAKAVIAVSKHLMGGLQRNGLIKWSNFIIPNVVEHYQIKKRTKARSTKVEILTISALLDNVKNISGLIKAIGKLSKKHPNVELHVIGGGPDKKTLTKLTKNIGLTKHVFFHGHVPNKMLDEYFKKMDFFALNSNFETFSLATAEALASGLPVVVTKCGGPEEFVVKNVGVLVEPGNERDLIRGLGYMIKNFNNYDSREITNYAKAMFSPEVVGKMIYKVYSTVLKMD